jgi:hypothetical protein
VVVPPVYRLTTRARRAVVFGTQSACGVEPERGEIDKKRLLPGPLSFSYLFSGSGCRAATTPPRAAAERLGRNAWFAGNLCAAARGATRRSATSSTALNRYSFSEEERERNPVACSKRIFCRTQLARRPCHQTILFPSLCAVGSDRNTRARRPCHYATTAVTLLTSFPKFRPPNSGSPCLCSASSPGL